MCIGYPMRVIEGDDMTALCEREGRVTKLSMLLIGEQAPGTFVLSHLGSAVRVLEAEDAERIDEALLGLAEAEAGQAFEHRFADLVDGRTQLPGPPR